jgi:Serine acetyltransferase
MNLLRKILSDAYRHRGVSTARSAIELFRTDPAFRFLAFFRALQNFRDVPPLRVVLGFFYRHYKHKFGIQIPPGTQIGCGIFMPHFGGIVINSRAIIGSNCTIMHGVTIGSVLSGPRAGTPVLESNVYVGPNAVIVGGVTIGANAIIAPSAFVNINVPPNSLAIGNPARIVPNRGSGVDTSTTSSI